jgi:hypothetical protein
VRRAVPLDGAEDAITHRPPTRATPKASPVRDGGGGDTDRVFGPVGPPSRLSDESSPDPTEEEFDMMTFDRAGRGSDVRR